MNEKCKHAEMDQMEEMPVETGRKVWGVEVLTSCQKIKETKAEEEPALVKSKITTLLSCIQLRCTTLEPETGWF